MKNNVKENNNSKGVIILLCLIIVILLALCTLFATGTISLNVKDTSNKNKSAETKENNDLKEDNINNNGQDNNNVIDRNEIVAKLKKALNDGEWVNNNLYTKENCFGNEVTADNQKLTFSVLEDNNNNPIVIVQDYSLEDFVITCYKVYYNNGNIKIKNIIDGIGHPGHGGISIDKDKGIVAYSWMHMGNVSFTTYNIKDDDIKRNDEYSCSTGDCDDDIEEAKKYNLSDISLELNNDNINYYLK